MDPTTQLTNLLSTILHQNYLCYNNRFYTPNKDITVGSTIQSMYGEIFLQHYENLWIKHWLETKIITYYRRYIDDIIIMHDTRKTDDTSILNNMKQIHKYLTFKLKTEERNKLNFLNLEITRKTNQVKISISGNQLRQVQPYTLTQVT
jgi:hypothetical protein